LKSKDWKVLILKAEQHPYFKGQIGFLLHFSGIVSYHEKNNNCDWDEEQNLLYYSTFNNYYEKASPVFELVHENKKMDYLWERAVLSKGVYLLRKSYDRLNFLSTNKKIRDFSWKRLLRLSPIVNKEENIHQLEKMNYVKMVFDDPLFDPQNLEKSLTNIIKEPVEDWRKHFIDDPSLINFCGQGIIKFTSPKNILLLGSSQLNHYHAELYSYMLFLKMKKDSFDITPFDRTGYAEVRGREESPGACLKEWTYKKVKYELFIYFNSEQKEQYKIVLTKAKNHKNTEQLDDLIKEINIKGLICKGEDALFWGYELNCKTEKAAINKVKLILEKLRAL